ncbi:MAG: tetratricopeptide repeat protein, partial [Bacteroidia bacterium]|nr:tetratricopeptide repeat protein [Bacteroidia bacterium]
GLAQVYMEMGNYREVEKLLESAYDINKRKLGESNPATIKVMQEQANYYRLTGNYDKALVLIGKVLNYKSGIYGENHPSYIQALEDMALIYWGKGSISDAKEAYTKVLGDTRNYIATYFNTLNENEKNVYWDKTRNRIQRFYSFAYSNYAAHPELINQMLNTIIATKGFLLNGSSKLRNTIMQSDDAELKKTYKKWLDTKENLNSAYQLSKEELAQEKINLDSLQKKADEYERILSKKSSLFNDNKAVTISKYDTIQKLLGATEAAVEIVQVNEFKNTFTGYSNYIALILDKKGIMVKDIGRDEIIDTAIATFRTKIIDQQTPIDIYPVVWQSIDSALISKTKVYLSLDGAFHQLSI